MRQNFDKILLTILKFTYFTTYLMVGSTLVFNLARIYNFDQAFLDIFTLPSSNLIVICLQIVNNSFFNLFWSLSSFSTYPWAITVAHPDDCSAGDLLAADQFCLISKSCPLMSLMRQTENPITLNARMFPK